MDGKINQTEQGVNAVESDQPFTPFEVGVETGVAGPVTDNYESDSPAWDFGVVTSDQHVRSLRRQRGEK